MHLHSNPTKFATVTLDPHQQNLDQLHAVVASIINRAGCVRCGLVAMLSIEFQGDPPEVLSKQNVTSYVEQGLSVH